MKNLYIKFIREAITRKTIIAIIDIIIVKLKKRIINSNNNNKEDNYKNFNKSRFNINLNIY